MGCIAREALPRGVRSVQFPVLCSSYFQEGWEAAEDAVALVVAAAALEGKEQENGFQARAQVGATLRLESRVK